MIDQLLASTRDKMRKAFEVTHTDLSSIRSGRASPALVENIVISAYGGSQKLKLMEMATITTLDTKTIAIAPFDPSAIDDIEKGIRQANIGLTPIVDREVIRIAIPPLSAERREEYLKLAKAKLEAGRVMIRQVRQESMHRLKNSVSEKEISEDDESHAQKKVQELTDEMIAEIDSLGARKEAELLQV